MSRKWLICIFISVIISITAIVHGITLSSSSFGSDSKSSSTQLLL